MRARLAGLAALLLLPACGLPLPNGVQSAGQVQPQRAEPAVIEILPPGPEPGASPEQIVRGFLNAQSSPDDDHAVARQFLAPGTDWDDEAGALIYDLGTRSFEQDPGDPTSFAVRFQTTARISADGAYSLAGGLGSRPYVVARQPDGEHRLVGVPPGLLLTTGDRDRSFRPYDVYFLGRGPDGRPVPRLVPDRVFLPRTAEPAQALTDALLGGASAALGGAVVSAAPEGTTAAASAAEGVVTVDLSPEVATLDRRSRQRLAAQLVWTLVPTFSGVRLTVQGEPLDAPGADEVQDRSDWEEYDPAGSVEQQTGGLYYVRDRVLRSLAGPALPDSEATRPGGLPVDQVAVSPAGGDLALVTRSPDRAVLRVGPQEGPFAEALAKPALRSPSWGPGTQGVWVVEPGPSPILWRVPGPGAPAGSVPQAVPYPQPRGAGPLSTMRVSRDGARIALIFGQGKARRLYVARVEPASGGLRVTGADPIAPGQVDVTDVAWTGGTSLVMLASAGELTQLVLWTIEVDGSTGAVPVPRQGLQGTPRALAAMPGQPLVVAAQLDGRAALFRDNRQLFQLLDETGGAPAYPG